MYETGGLLAVTRGYFITIVRRFIVEKTNVEPQRKNSHGTINDIEIYCLFITVPFGSVAPINRKKMLFVFIIVAGCARDFRPPALPPGRKKYHGVGCAFPRPCLAPLNAKLTPEGHSYFPIKCQHQLMFVSCIFLMFQVEIFTGSIRSNDMNNLNGTEGLLGPSWPRC